MYLQKQLRNLTQKFIFESHHARKHSRQISYPNLSCGSSQRVAENSKGIIAERL